MGPADRARQRQSQGNCRRDLSRGEGWGARDFQTINSAAAIQHSIAIMPPYSVLVVGMGKRGMHHAAAFNANPRFKVAGICDIDPQRLADAAPKLGNPQTGAEAAALAKALRPDIFCFCTLPNLRTPMLKAAVEGGAKLVAFEKP